MSCTLSRRRSAPKPGPGLFQPTTAHLILWVQRNKPTWAKDLDLPARASVDEIINARAGIKWTIGLCNALSLIVLVRSNQARGAYPPNGPKTLREYMATFDGRTSHDRDRARHYARWARGIARAANR